MNVTLWMAMSLNGMTAREDLSEDFLSRTDWDMFLELVRASDALVWGRVTHELFESPVRKELPELPMIVVTRNADYRARPGSYAAPSPKEALAALERRGAHRVLLAGGGHLNAGFAQAGLIDEIVLAIEPVIIGRGIPLVVGDAPDLRLELSAIEDDRRPTLRVRYRVLR